MKLIKYLFILILSCYAVHVFAASAGQSPVTMLRQVSTQAMNKLKMEKSKLNGKKVSIEVVHNIVEEVLLTHVDLDHMSKVVLGRNTWNSASAAQKLAFKNQFTDLVINTYSSALTTFDKNRIKFYRIRGGYEGKAIVQVNSTVSAPGAQPLPVVYHLEHKNNKWLIFDLSVDGISLVQSYQAQFVPLIREKGLDGLIDKLKTHNAKLLSKPTGTS